MFEGTLESQNRTASAPLQGKTRKRQRINWALWLGLLLVLFITAIAIWGPELAARDPLERNPIIRVGEDWLAPPFAPFQTPGFPLGSDAEGRDIFSQVLWAVRPTLILVTVAAILRLILGTLIGLAAGWAGRSLARWLDMLISLALTIPVLIAALAVIAAVGIEYGVRAFLLGLVATGWADSARQVREQARSIKTQEYIEAARALGASNPRLLMRHVLRQIAPMLWMLFAFEISATMLTTAGLGFLGYYIGGEVWLAITDTVAQRVSGMPELGLMLATLSSDMFTGPWKMVAAGTLIFITILGFNLIGEGLRSGLDPRNRRETALARARERGAMWWDRRLVQPMSAWLSAGPGRRLLLAALPILLLAGLILYWRAGPATTDVQMPESVLAPGGQHWATQRYGPSATWQTPARGVQTPVIAWSRRALGESAGGPAVAANGTVYFSTVSGALLAQTSQQVNAWVSPAYLPDGAVGAPALSAEGRIYASLQTGGLSAISLNGRVLWDFQPETDAGEAGAATSGPVVDTEGNIYYMRGSAVQAVSPQGEGLWLRTARARRTILPPAISPDGRMLFVEDSILDIKNGERLQISGLPEADQFLVGGDGRTYLRQDNLLSEWTLDGDQAQVVRQIDWDWQRTVFGLPRAAGVTADGSIWLLYYSPLEDAQLVWLDKDGNVLSSSRYPQRETEMIGVDRQDTAYLCGTERQSGPQCLAIRAGQEAPLWQISLPGDSAVSGGALSEGWLYVTLEEGVIIAIAEQAASGGP